MFKNNTSFEYLTQNFDFSTLKCISKDEGEYIDIDKVIPDKYERMAQFGPEVIALRTSIYKYRIDEKTTVTRKITTKKVREKKSVVDRRKNWKPFGKAAISNDGTLTIGKPVYMQLTNRHGNFPEEEDTADRICKMLKNKTSNTGFKISGNYKPNMGVVKNIKNCSENFDDSFSINKKGYIPKFIKNKMEENNGLQNFSIVVKNLPTNFSRKDVEAELKTLFSEFGQIRKINILMDKYNPTQIRNIGFIDFNYASDAINALKSNKRMIIGCCIISKEKANKK